MPIELIIIIISFLIIIGAIIFFGLYVKKCKYLKKNYNVFIKAKKGKVFINTDSGAIKYRTNLFNIAEIEKYQLQKNEKVLFSSGIGEAIVGGILFGGTGAMAGAYLGKKEKYKTTCVLFIETNNIIFAGVTIPVTEESGFKICRVFDLFHRKRVE